jgi:hypothetical protein
VASPIYGQQSNTFYLMHDVPQSNLLNPAVQLMCKYFIGIPVVSSVHVNYTNTAFTYNDVASTGTWDFEGILEQMHRTDLYSVEAMLQPLSLGYRQKSNYFTFHITEQVYGYQTVPKDLAEVVVYGNGSFTGETARFNSLRPGGFHIRKYSLGVSRLLGPYLTAGIRGNLLFGKANITVGRSRMELGTREDNFGITLNGDYLLNGSFPATITLDSDGNINGIELEEIEPLPYAMNRGNPGFSVDLGVIYSYDERITLSASLLDLGFLVWRTDLNNVSGGGSFIFTGLDLNESLISEGYIRDIADSIQQVFEVDVTQDSYTYFLPAQLFLAGSYRFRENLSFGLVNRNLIFRSKLHSSLTVSAQANLADRFLATASWSYLNNSLKNVGIGIAYHARGIQFHAVTDNLLGFFYPFNTRTLNLRAGISLMLGCPRGRSEQRREDFSGFLPGDGECPYPEKPSKKRKKREKAVRKLNRR